MLALVLVARGAVAAPLLVNSPQHRLPFPRWELLPAFSPAVATSVSPTPGNQSLVTRITEARSVCSAVGLSRAHSRHASGRSGRPSVR